MRIPILGRDGHIHGSALAHLGRDEIVRIRDGGAGVAACCARLFDVLGWLGAYGEWGAAGGGDGGGQGLKAFEVGHAEGTPVAAVDWWWWWLVGAVLGGRGGWGPYKRRRGSRIGILGSCILGVCPW